MLAVNMRQYDAAVVGFALRNCQQCHGTGRLGYLNGVESGVVQPCGCVVFFEKARLEEEYKKDAEQEQQRASDSPKEP